MLRRMAHLPYTSVFTTTPTTTCITLTELSVNVHTRFLQPLNLSSQPYLSSTSSQYLLLICCHSSRPPTISWKSQIAHLDMHHLVFGINFQVHSVSLNRLVSIYLLIHLSTYFCQHPRSHQPALLHSFTPCSKPTFSINP